MARKETNESPLVFFNLVVNAHLQSEFLDSDNQTDMEMKLIKAIIAMFWTCLQRELYPCDAVKPKIEK